MKKLFSILISTVMAVGPSFAKNSSEVVTNDDVILHAWSWSFNTIRQNMADIAAAGYTIVQTSPAQHCIEGKNGGRQLYGKGRWYYYYQPTDWQIGNYVVGTADDLKALCLEAEKYGIRVIVDVIPNHTCVDQSKVAPEFDTAVGGRENLYHANGLTEIRDYNNRLQCTTGRMGGLPDVNTENPRFQAYFMKYINNLIACGVQGFRYDTAKHIGLPSDPLDAKSEKNNFWPVATGRESALGVSLSVSADDLFIYGEVLQDKNVKELEYAEYMRLTASSYGGAVRRNLTNASWKKADVTSYSHPIDPSMLISWVESHDTYCNEHESAHLSDEQIRLGWVYITARAYSSPLFYNRPDGSDGPKGNYWGKNEVGIKGNDNFKHPLVVAANTFRHKMKGQPEKITYSKNTSVVQVGRGSKGAALVNISASEQPVSMRTKLPKGIYRDAVSGQTFNVSRGVIRGVLLPQTAVLLVKE